ncbi:MAG: AAC(3) family N-acetyltransferase [Aquabacterium sp.]|nr:AAC(3) family N-acetyltransferase [Aquabacterium sp.]
MKKTLKRALPHLPKPLQQWLRSLAERKRQADKAKRKERTQVRLDDLLAQLDAFDLKGDIILHSSLSNIGKFDCSPEQIADAFFGRLVGPGRTLLVPALPYNTTMKEYLDGATGFDVRSAPNAMGAIPNILMGRSDALRSVHPSHSVIALGERAAEFVSHHEMDATPFGENSPYRKLTMSNGSILMVGVGLNSVTNFHVYEDLLGDAMPIQVYLPSPRKVPCVRGDGSPIDVTAVCHDPRVSAIRQCERARPFLQEEGAIRTTPFGESELSIIDARGFSRTLLKMLLAGESIYGPVSLNGHQRQAVHSALEHLA